MARASRPWFRHPLVKSALIAWACAVVAGLMAYRPGAAAYLETLDGHVYSGVGWIDPIELRLVQILNYSIPTGSARWSDWSWHGFEYAELGSPTIGRRLSFPYGVVDVLLCLPLIGWFGLLGRERRIVGRAYEIVPTCRRCGYDLRATPDRCPECGTVPDR